MLAESKGLVLRDYRQFWMGHKGDIERKLARRSLGAVLGGSFCWWLVSLRRS